MEKILHHLGMPQMLVLYKLAELVFNKKQG